MTSPPWFSNDPGSQELVNPTATPNKLGCLQYHLQAVPEFEFSYTSLILALVLFED